MNKIDFKDPYFWSRDQVSQEEKGQLLIELLEWQHEMVEARNSLNDIIETHRDSLYRKQEQINKLEARMNRAEKNLADHEQTIGRLNYPSDDFHGHDKKQMCTNEVCYYAPWPHLTHNDRPITAEEFVEHYSVTPQSEEKWQPKEDEVYWYITSTADLVQETDFKNTSFDKARFEFGNYFKTEEEAQQMATKIKNLLKGGE